MVNEKLQHSPSTSRHADRSDEMGMGWTSESFCEYVGAVVLCGNISDLENLLSDLVADEMILHADVFCASVELVVMGVNDGSLIVAKDGGRFRLREG